MAQNPDAPTFAITETDKILKCVSALGNQLTLSQSIGQRAKSQFDGLSSDHFVKWMTTVDNIYLKVDRDGKMTLWAAAQLLRGSALGYYHEIALSLSAHGIILNSSCRHNTTTSTILTQPNNES